jgi:hypothetical protein
MTERIDNRLCTCVANIIVVVGVLAFVYVGFQMMHVDSRTNITRQSLKATPMLIGWASLVDRIR